MNIIYKLVSIGILPSDNDSIQLRKRFMNAMALLMSMGGLLWGSISYYYDAYLAAAIPFSYTFLTGVNLTVYHFRKNFASYRFLQVLMSLLLPFFFQWSLGGVINSGGMMLWSFLALVGSMSVQDVKHSFVWLGVYIVIVILTGFVDHYFHHFSLNLSTQAVIWFFVINVAFISAVIFSLTLYFIHSRNTANDELKELTQTLEQKVLDRTAEISLTNAKLSSTNDELYATIEQVNEKNKVIELKNKNITDSLNYAKRIQKAILSRSNANCSKINEHFVLFRPKDIVSGDFYWFHCTDEGDFIAAVVDCTGHGVPGAFMSIIADSLLNQIILDNKITDPAEVLYEMDKGIEKALKAEESNRRDGMDMAIVTINPKTRQMRFAGAKNPVVFITNGELNIMKGEPHAIGGGAKQAKVFKTHATELKPNTMIYLFSDGYYDQFGGHDARKYLAKYFRKFLVKVANLPANTQKRELIVEFEQWRGTHPQTDDVLVVGIRI